MFENCTMVESAAFHLDVVHEAANDFHEARRICFIKSWLQHKGDYISLRAFICPCLSTEHHNRVSEQWFTLQDAGLHRPQQTFFRISLEFSCL